MGDNMFFITSNTEIINAMDKINSTLASPDYLGIFLTFITVAFSSYVSFSIAKLTINSDKNMALTTAKKNDNNTIMYSVLEKFLPFKDQEQTYFAQLNSGLYIFFLELSILPNEEDGDKFNWYQDSNNTMKVAEKANLFLKVVSEYSGYLINFKNDIDLLLIYFSENDYMYNDLKEFQKLIKHQLHTLSHIRQNLAMNKNYSEYTSMIYNLSESLDTAGSVSSKDLYLTILHNSNHLKFDPSVE